MKMHSMTTTLALRCVVAIALTAPAVALAQDGTAPNNAAQWKPWLGCWIPVERTPRDQDIQVCVIPTPTGAGARLMTFAGDQRILDETILADGSTQRLAEQSCTGSSRSLWSRDSARLFRLTELACEGKSPQRTAGISTLESGDEWLDIQVVVVGGSENVRTRHYVRSAGAPPAVIADEVRALPSASTLPPATVSVEDVIEANAVVSHRAVEAWLAESRTPVPVNKHTLLALHEAKVPTHMIDLMVGLAYPKRFEIRRSGSSGSFGSFGSFSGFDDDAVWSSQADYMFDPYAFYYSPFGSYHGLVDPAYLAFGGYVTIPGTNATAAESGPARVVNGSGYTRVEPRQPVATVGRTPGSSTSDSSGSDSSSSSGSSSSSSGGGGSASPAGYSSGGDGGGGQTAVPR